MAELLDLSTIVERDTVRLRTKKNSAGRVYEVLNLSDLGPYEHEVIRNAYAKVESLTRTTRKLTAVEKRSVRKALRDITALIIPSIEETTLAEAEDNVLAAIITAWAAKVNAVAAASEEGNVSTPRRHTGTSSRRSKGSTAGSRKRGSTPRRG